MHPYVCFVYLYKFHRRFHGKVELCGELLCVVCHFHHNWIRRLRPLWSASQGHGTRDRQYSSSCDIHLRTIPSNHDWPELYVMYSGLHCGFHGSDSPLSWWLYRWLLTLTLKHKTQALLQEGKSGWVPKSSNFCLKLVESPKKFLN